MIALADIVEDSTIDIGECCLDTDMDIALDEARHLLDEGERAREARFVFERDRDRFVRAHGYLRQRLGDHLGMAPARVPIIAPDGGKPFVRDGAVRFSLSHSGSRAVLAVTHAGEIGVDLEMEDRSGGFVDQLDDLIRFCLTATEQEALSTLSEDQRIRGFLSCWTAKEARMKLTGEGLTLEPKAITLQFRHGWPVGYIRPSMPVGLRFVALSRPDAICCVAFHEADGSSKRGGNDGQG